MQIGLLVMGGLFSVLASVIWSAELLKYKNENGNEVKFKPDYSLFLNLVGGIFVLGGAGYLKWG